MNRLGDYFYATIPSICLAIPVAQILPDLSFLMGIEKLGASTDDVLRLEKHTE